MLNVHDNLFGYPKRTIIVHESHTPDAKKFSNGRNYTELCITSLAVGDYRDIFFLKSDLHVLAKRTTH